MVYIKHMVSSLELNTWGFVLYNNLLSLMIAPIFWFLTGEYTDVFTAVNANGGSLFEPVAFCAVALSCVFGFLISFFGFAARKAISATAFTVTGVVNKFLTVVINVLIWDKHASPVGLVCLLVTICGGIGYQQSVTVAKKPTSGPAQVLNDSEKVDEESVELIPGKVATNVWWWGFSIWVFTFEEVSSSNFVMVSGFYSIIFVNLLLSFSYPLIQIFKYH